MAQPLCTVPTALPRYSGANRLAHQNRAHGPLAAEAEALQSAGNQQLPERGRKPAKERKHREPHHRPLQNPGASIFIGKQSGKPSAQRRDQQRRRAQQTCLSGADVPQGNQAWKSETDRPSRPGRQGPSRQRSRIECSSRQDSAPETTIASVSCSCLVVKFVPTAPSSNRQRCSPVALAPELLGFSIQKITLRTRPARHIPRRFVIPQRPHYARSPAPAHNSSLARTSVGAVIAQKSDGEIIPHLQNCASILSVPK